eukprot:TRINITY_DN5111_c0_g1_i1.p1 TRINITY_DN5111_c0_g1~~TRINITY_DN5111_c0_g1_i1.p1  ORF type:complete len:688 (+),score=135.95 TRINITY_DN5111_c0_g1_i1:69-2066(+)
MSLPDPEEDFSLLSLSKILLLVDTEGIHAFEKVVFDEDMVFLKLVSEFLRCTPLSLLDEAVDVVYRLFVGYGREVRLLDWSIDVEFDESGSVDELFRMKSFSSMLLDKPDTYFFLRNMVVPILILITDIPEIHLSLVPDNVTSTVDLVDKNLELLFSQCDFIFQYIEENNAELPSVLCHCFSKIEQMTETKFPDYAQNVVPIVFCLRFLCPTLMHPQNFGFNDLPTYVYQFLVNLSKLLQSVANGLSTGICKNNITKYEPHNEKIQNYIMEAFPKVRSACQSFMFPIDSNTDYKSEISDDEELLQEAFSFFTTGGFINTLRDKVEHEIIKKRNMTIKENMIQIWKKKFRGLSQQSWKDSKAKENVSSYKLEKNKTHDLILKFNTIVPVLLNEAIDKMCSWTYEHWVELIFSDRFLNLKKCEVEKETLVFQNWKLAIKIPLSSEKIVVVQKMSDIGQESGSFYFVPLPDEQSNLEIQFYLKPSEYDKQSTSIECLYSLKLNSMTSYHTANQLHKEALSQVVRVRKAIDSPENTYFVELKKKQKKKIPMLNLNELKQKRKSIELNDKPKKKTKKLFSPRAKIQRERSGTDFTGNSITSVSPPPVNKVQRNRASTSPDVRTVDPNLQEMLKSLDSPPRMRVIREQDFIGNDQNLFFELESPDIEIDLL